MGAEITEILNGIKTRYGILGVEHPWGVIVDNCCTVRSSIKHAFDGDTQVYLDIYHCIDR